MTTKKRVAPTPSIKYDSAEIGTLDISKWQVGMYVVYNQSEPHDSNPALEFSLGVIETISFPETGGASLDILCCGYKTANNIRSEVGRVYECVQTNKKDKKGQFVWRKADSVAPDKDFYTKAVCKISSEDTHWVYHFQELFQRGKGTSTGVFLKACVVADCLPRSETKKQKI